MEKNKQVVDTGEIVCGFAVRKTFEGQKDFDECYKEVTIKQRVKKIGDGEDDFIIEEYEDIKEIPIREVIDAQVDQVGIEAYMRPYTMIGEEPPFIGFDDVDKAPIQDFSQFPEEPMLSQDVHGIVNDLWANMDPALKGECKSVEEFLSSITDERLKSYYASKLNVEKVEEKKDEK